MAYSSRAIIYAQRISLSPILYKARNHCYLYDNFYEKAVLDSDLYDQKIRNVKEVIDELELVLSICFQKVTFSSVRDGIEYARNANMNYIEENSKATVDGIDYTFSDASDEQWGCFICVNNRSFAIAGKFDDKTRMGWSINAKECFALLLCQVIVNLLRHMNSSWPKRTLYSYIDNTTTQSIGATLRVSLRSRVLAKMAKCLMMMRMACDSKVIYLRIDSSSNWTADYLSRKSDVILEGSEIISALIMSLIDGA